MRLSTALMGGSQQIPTVSGTPYGGGFYVGRMLVGAQKYALIVAPKASGQTTSAWKATNTTTANTASAWDGFSNTAAMVADAVNHAAAQWCAALSIGGFADWFLPATEQLELCYRNLKPRTNSNDAAAASGFNGNSDPQGITYTASDPAQTPSDAFRYVVATNVHGPEEFDVTAAYWTSTNASAASTYTKEFLTGARADATKVSSLLVRACRMIKIG
ncbi:hypothetical protein PMI35_00964 [Pseudomonas sp. GM78]|uniref:hypothetical protein n=1 Tax=Pseudomonas sp. GM78 TaxID=1144337 RepID=UPI00026F4856|nr:hypothetical protein [Pseudomonas sp. GM78]EJN32778.1 hypothetical protein PMI35_00964 [Pseudomonas sp. GM78]